MSSLESETTSPPQISSPWRKKTRGTMKTDSEKSDRPALVVTFEGPVGCGKGFLLKHIKQHGLPCAESIQVELHEDAVSHVYDSHQNPARWGLFTELDFLFRHVSAYCSVQKDHCDVDVILLEGSHVADRFCYYEMIKHHLTPMEQQLYEECISVICKFDMSHKTIYMDCDIHDCLQRIMDNCKREQYEVDLLELHRLQRLYRHHLPADTCHLTCTANFEDNEPLLEAMRYQISDMVKEWLREHKEKDIH